MNKKWLPIVLILVMAAAVIIIKKDQGNNKPAPKPKVNNNTGAKDPADRERGFDRRISYLKYSNHANCRMQCRKISQVEVQEIMQNGNINYEKSDLQNARCPRYTVEGITADRQRVRVVFAQCNESTTVVTVIDLDTEYECNCPGDDDKYKNRKG